MHGILMLLLFFAIQLRTMDAQASLLQTSRTSRAVSMPKIHDEDLAEASLLSLSDSDGYHQRASTSPGRFGASKVHDRLHSGGQNHGPLPADWFGAFHKGESTYDADGVGDGMNNPERLAARVSEQGSSINRAMSEDREPIPDSGFHEEWFEESMSGGAYAAWRTRYPQLEQYHRTDVMTAPWLPDHYGRHHQPFLPEGAIIKALDITKKKDATWFEDSVSHFDDFGRNRPPSEKSDRFYYDWEKKNWTARFGCTDPGCTANTLMDLVDFNATAMQYAKCSLSVGVHVTDFDDQYSREHVEWIIVNGVKVSVRCDPMGRDCNSTVPIEKRGLYQCVSDYPVDFLLNRSTTGTQLNTTGTQLNITGKITEMVDECPVKTKSGDNLLSGEARVTCFVKPLPPPRPQAVPVLPRPLQLPESCPNKTVLQCANHGCSADAVLSICVPPRQGETCKLSVRIWETDFDNDHGSIEIVEWLKVNGTEITKIKQPSRNPCKEVFQGKANRSKIRDSEDDMILIVSDEDVTDVFSESQDILIEAKISNRVDECAKDGWLLNAVASVECK